MFCFNQIEQKINKWKQKLKNRISNNRYSTPHPSTSLYRDPKNMIHWQMVYFAHNSHTWHVDDVGISTRVSSWGPEGILFKSEASSAPRHIRDAWTRLIHGSQKLSKNLIFLTILFLTVYFSEETLSIIQSQTSHTTVPSMSNKL
jgi:hypothetical protein